MNVCKRSAVECRGARVRRASAEARARSLGRPAALPADGQPRWHLLVAEGVVGDLLLHVEAKREEDPTRAVVVRLGAADVRFEKPAAW
eukprot:6208608-Pleurochrysis_carterae.AAC.4